MDNGGAAARAVAPPKKSFNFTMLLFRSAGEVDPGVQCLGEVGGVQKKHRARNSEWEFENSPAQREHSPLGPKEEAVQLS